MATLGRLVKEKFHNTVPHYFADHNLQLTTQKAIRLGGIAKRGENEDGDIVMSLKKARDLVSHVSQSPLANGKLANAQKLVSPQAPVLVLIQDVKTRWWSTYMMLRRIYALKAAIIRMFRDEFYNRDQGKGTLLEQFALSEKTLL